MAGPARARGAVSGGIAGGLIIVIWQANHRGMSASHWHPGTSVAGDARRLDWAKSALGSPNPYPGFSQGPLAEVHGGLCGSFQGPHAPQPHRPHVQELIWSPHPSAATEVIYAIHLVYTPGLLRVPPEDHRRRVKTSTSQRPTEAALLEQLQQD